jgi:hypothetical protein
MHDLTGSILTIGEGGDMIKPLRRHAEAGGGRGRRFDDDEGRRRMDKKKRCNLEEKGVLSNLRHDASL